MRMYQRTQLFLKYGVTFQVQPIQTMIQTYAFDSNFCLESNATNMEATCPNKQIHYQPYKSYTCGAPRNTY